MKINKAYLAALLEQHYEDATDEENEVFHDLIADIGKVVQASGLSPIGSDSIYAVAEVVAENIGEADLVFIERE